MRRSNLVPSNRRHRHLRFLRRAAAGYILVETAVALVVLSAGAFAIHRTIQEAIRTRGQAQDFTRARFLLDSVANRLLLQPLLTEDSKAGQFDGPDARFAWQWTVRRVDPPLPATPLKPPPQGETSRPLEIPRESAYLAHVLVSVSWQRGGIPFTESYETLLPPERLWQPPPLPRRNQP